jgi:hypothetical protein
VLCTAPTEQVVPLTENVSVYGQEKGEVMRHRWPGLSPGGCNEKVQLLTKGP